mmetsp:Transcript_17546/g.31733  ORF Transcript_17546/g.31733 Transcript_17546/m.31733 type:complete len:664 (-) Transcript_17546:287-2278(-)
MVTKIKKFKQRHHRPKVKGSQPNAATIDVNDDPQQEGNNDPTSSINDNGGTTMETEHASTIDTLISQLKDHLDQGRIFDARTLVQKLRAFESSSSNDPNPTAKFDDAIQQLMEEVITQSDHVESLLHELHSDDGWMLAKDKSGVTVHYRRDPNSPIHTVRAVTTFDNFSPKDFVRFCSLFVETECMHLWFPGGVMNGANVLSWHSKYSKVIQLHISLRLPMVSPRDAIVLGSGYHLPDRNAFLISSKTILEDTCRFCDIPKPGKGIVRMATESIFYVELMKGDVISFKMIGRDDLKLKYMPSTLLNYLSQGHLPFDLMKTIHGTIRNFSGSVWEKKIEERGAYYTEIEDKVYEQMKTWEKDGVETSESSGIQNGDKSGENIDVISETPLSTNPKSSSAKCNAKKEGQNCDVTEGDDESQTKYGPFTVVVIVTTLSAIISSVLYVMAFPETIPILAPTVLRELSEGLRTENMNMILAIITWSVLLPLIIFISLFAGVRQPHEHSLATDWEQAIMNGDGEVDKPRAVDSVSGDYGEKDADSKLETKTKNDGLDNSEGVRNGREEFTKTEAVPSGVVQSNQSDNDTSSPLLEEITLTPHAPHAGGSQKLQPTSPSSQPKLIKVRSSHKFRPSLNNGLRKMKKVASLKAVTGKKSLKARDKPSSRKY